MRSRPADGASFCKGDRILPTLQLTDYIRAVPDFPKPGILFRDITPLLHEPAAFRQAVDMLAQHYRTRKVDLVAAVEARGFIFAAPLALELDAGLVPIRKAGKLPCQTLTYTYDLEYGCDTLQVHADAIAPGANVLLVDDLLATGGTIEACCQMVEKAGGCVAGCGFVIELSALGGARRIAQYDKHSLIQYE
jgi:adenine phosphoribosyltransferase